MISAKIRAQEIVRSFPTSELRFTSGAMHFTILATLAACQATGMRPELSRTKMSQKIATVGDLVSKISDSQDSRAALQAASGILDGILAEAGNATEHMSDDDAALLRSVIELVEKSIYGSMDSAHTADTKSLNDAKAAVEQCNIDIVARQAADGDLGQLHQHVTDKQTELNRLQGIVDEKTLANATEWERYDQHMQMIAAPPACPGLPSRTMPALDVYFEKSEYSIWFAAQKAAYDTARDKYTAADGALQTAIKSYNIQKAVRDTQYCDWRAELNAACAKFDVCFETASGEFNALVPVVTSDMNQRIENLKAGDTLVQQIKFLLAESKSRESPASDVSRYTIAFPLLGVKADCDMSVLDDAKWVPTPSCAPAPDFTSRPGTRGLGSCAVYNDTLPGELLRKSSHSVVMVLDVKDAATAATKRQWIFNLGQRGSRAEHWLYNANHGIDRVQFGAWNGQQIKSADLSKVRTIAATYDSASRLYSLYLDGKFDSSTVVDLDIRSGDMLLGGRALGGESDFLGCVKGVDVFRHALSPEHVIGASERLLNSVKA